MADPTEDEEANLNRSSPINDNDVHDVVPDEINAAALVGIEETPEDLTGSDDYNNNNNQEDLQPEDLALMADNATDQNESIPLHDTSTSRLPLSPASPQPQVETMPRSRQANTLSSRWQACINSPLLLIYLSHGLSSWGDRMWAFTMGMLLVDWEQLQSLRTVAIHQLCCAIAVFIFGALIGSWVDRARRLRATVSSIIAQNIFVSASAAVLLVLLKATEGRKKDDPALWYHHLAIAFSIGFSTIAYLASVACHLTVGKDWVPALCNENAAKLTSTNAILKRIDLTTAILSPVLAGATMELAGAWAGGLVVVVWNIISAPCEIFLLYSVYKKNSQLRVPKQPQRPTSSASNTSNGSGSAKRGCCGGVPIMRPAVTLFRGWSCYWQQVVRWSGASLSALYFTVLSLDAVTTGYVRSLCVSELVVAAVGIGSFVLGLVGTIVFPHIRKAFGLRRGGAIFYIGHAAILAIAVVSVFLPGSPFAPISTNNNAELLRVADNSSTFSPSTTTIFGEMMTTSEITTAEPTTTTGNLMLDREFNSTANFTHVTSSNEQCAPGDNIGGFRMPHLCVLTAAMILSRLTLWGTDLSINQVLVERVNPKQRGVVNGVQGSLNQLVDLFRLVTVICVPYPDQFGWLVIATFVFIALGSVVYVLGAPPDEIVDTRQKNDRFAGRNKLIERKWNVLLPLLLTDIIFASTILLCFKKSPFLIRY